MYFTLPLLIILIDRCRGDAGCSTGMASLEITAKNKNNDGAGITN